MKFVSVAVVSVLFCAVCVYAGHSSITAAELRESIKCVDGVFRVMAEEHKEMEKYHDSYKVLAKMTYSQLDRCEQEEDPETERKCVEATTMMFDMIQLSRILTDIQDESKEIANKFLELLLNKCDNVMSADLF